MNKKERISITRCPKKIKLKPTHLPTEDTSQRDKKTNVCIPSEDEVIALKAWGEFCKL